MRRFLSLLLAFLPLYVLSQAPTTLEDWAERLSIFGQKIPQEEVFVHMDNTSYYLGDTIYFKAYVRLSDERPSGLSQLLYVELLNNDGYLVERQKIELKQGQGHGSICLPDTLYGGYYELRAYTRWQLNWGVYEHAHKKNSERWFLSQKMMREYYRDYDKLYSRVFPVYDHPRQPGDYAQDMTMRPMRRVTKQKNEPPKAIVTFYPEGGNLVQGVRNRIAFEANDENGKHLKGQLKIWLGAEKAFETEGRGRGCFEVVPGEEPLEGTFEWDGNVQTVRLPQIVQDGVALQANVRPDGIHVILLRSGAAVSEALGLTASCHGVQKFFQVIDGDKSETTVPLSVLPTGVIQLTVYNAQGRIYADRLVFVRQPDFQPQNVTFAGIKPQYEPYEAISVDVECAAAQSSNLSIAVRDAIHSDYTFDSGNILTEMLLASQIRGFVEQPEYFFEADDDAHRRALDLLLMVQGWRRYDWRQMATPGAFVVNHPYERTEFLFGEVSHYDAEMQGNAFMEDMDAHEQRSAEEQAYLSQRNSTLQGNDLSSISEAEAGTQTISEMGSSIDQRFSADATRQGTTQRTNAIAAEQRNNWRYENAGNIGSLKQEVVVHAEFMQPGVRKDKSMVVGDMDSYNNGLFKIEAPHFYEACYFSYDAVAKDKWKGEQHKWINTGEDQNDRLNYPDFYVKLTPPFPRFPKPYTFYQNTPPAARNIGNKRLWVGDKAILMDEVTIGARRGGLRSFDASKPAFVLDAYKAFNDVCDAGLCPGYYISAARFALDVARTYIGDMNMERAYELEMRFNSKNNSAFISSGIREKYNHLPCLDKVYVYTDYSPRQEGSQRYAQDNQPIVTVDLHRYEDDSRRMTWSNRHMVLTGYSVCEDFYQPDYSQRQPAEPTDYRRTLYWNPNVQLDGEGRATLRFYNNSRKTRLTLSAEGLAPDGRPLTGISYPEDR